MSEIKPKKTKQYVNNSDFLKALVDYKEGCKLAKKNKTEYSSRKPPP